MIQVFFRQFSFFPFTVIRCGKAWSQKSALQINPVLQGLDNGNNVRLTRLFAI
jgi:hypothetical protein